MSVNKITSIPVVLACAALLFICATAASASTTTATSVARFQGTLFQGVGTETLRHGGAAFTVQLSEGRFNDLPVSVLREQLFSGFTSDIPPGTNGCWHATAANGFSTAAVALSSHRKVLRVTLGAMPEYNCTKNEVISVHVVPSMLEANAPAAGPDFMIVPDGRLAFAVNGGWALTSSKVTLQFTGPEVVLLGTTPFKIVSGADCKGSKAAVEGAPQIDVAKHTMSFVPLQGGVMSICYSPDPAHPKLLVRAKGQLVVSGPEGFVADTTNPRALIEFKANVYGTNLTTQDLLILTTSSCSGALDTNDVYDVTLTSTSRATCYVTVPHDGLYNVCYLRNGASSYTHITSLVVQKGGEQLIEEDAAQFTVTEDTLVVRKVHIKYLTVGSGVLSLEGHTLNVSHLIWTGGEISGGGLINCMSEHTHIYGHSRNLVLDFSLINFGVMALDARHLTLTGSSVLFNSGEITLLINATNDDPAVISCQGSKASIVNSAKARLNIRFLGEKGALLVACPIINRGVITVSGAARVIFRNMDLSETSRLRVEKSAHVAFEQGTFRGSLTLGEASQTRFFERSAYLQRFKISGMGEVSLEAPSFVLDSIDVSGDVRFFIRGPSDPDAAPVTVEVYGFNTFSEKTMIAIGKAKLLSKSNAAHVLVSGRLLCHIPSVEFGDNVVVHAQLTTVMFGVGEKGVKHANLVPQRLPQNASFIIPPNATLVIMDVGNLTQQQLTDGATAPRVCASYVVVPMHVEVRGKVLLWGCAVLPFGGRQSGLIFGSNAAEITASVEYAFCRNVLAGSHVCVPMFPIDEVPPSGIAFGGEHEVSPPMLLTDEALRGGPQFSVDHVEILPSGVVKSLTGPLQILARSGMLVHDSAALSVTQGGYLTTKRLTVNGLIDADSAFPIRVNGDADIGPRATVRISADGKCTYPISVRDGIRFAHGSALQCARLLNLSDGDSAAFINADTVQGVPTLDLRSCTSRYTADLIMSTTAVGLRIEGAELKRSTSTMISGVVVSLIASVLLCAALCFRLTPTLLVEELRRRLEVPLQLSFPEFSSYLPNYAAVCSILLDAAFLCSTAFHPLVPLPPVVGHLVDFSTRTMLLHLASTSKVALVITALSILALWVFLWMPLALKRVSDRMKRLLHQREHYSHRYAIQLLFQFHTVASFASLALFIPTLSLLMDSIACSTVLRTSPDCAPLQRMMGPCVLGVGVFAYLAPYSASCHAFPFGHPPYQRDLDVRFKRSFAYLQYTLYFLQVCIWKVFAAAPLQLLCASLLIMAMLFALSVLSAPCAYSNINTIKSMSLLYPMWAALCSLTQVLRFGAHPQFVCSVSDPLYVALMVLGFVIITVGIVASLRRCVQAPEDIGESPLSIHLHSLMENYAKIEKRKMEMYNTDNSREREQISDNISALRIQYLQLLNNFRRKKERFLLPYYLGDAIGGTLLSSHLELDGTDTPHTPFDIPMKPLKAVPAAAAAATAAGGGVAADAEDELLTPDQMESFVRGPPLGSGSYGVVHMGMLPSGRLVAVKEIPISRKKKGALATVKKEVDLLRTLVHPNIIRYYGCHATTKQMSVFMEFAVGGSLTSLIRKFDKLSEGTMRMYTQQILLGLQYLHDKNIIHRDIKGENILINSDGVAKLSDFGCSKGLMDIAHKSQAGCGTLVGSPYWMAPEIIRSEEYGTKADIWSVGCTVVEMLNGGSPPWHEKFDNVYSAMYFIGSTTELPSNIPADVSDLCRSFLARCFERDVSKRATAAELLRHPWLLVAPEHPGLSSSTGGGSSSSTRSSPAGASGSKGGRGGSGDSPLKQREWSDLFDSASDATATATATATETGFNTATASDTFGMLNNGGAATAGREESGAVEDDDTAEDSLAPLRGNSPIRD